MKEENYQKHKEKVISFLKKQGCFCFRHNIINYLMIDEGMTRNAVIQTIREMRKRKVIKKAFRKWGLGIQ